MRKIIEIIPENKVNLLEHGIDLDKQEIVRLWTIYDLKRMWTWDSKTGKPITNTELEDVPLRHLEGVFLEDKIHDWSIRKGNLLDYYSRVVGRTEKVKILIEYKEKEVHS